MPARLAVTSACCVCEDLLGSHKQPCRAAVAGDALRVKMVSMRVGELTFRVTFTRRYNATLKGLYGASPETAIADTNAGGLSQFAPFELDMQAVGHSPPHMVSQ